MCLLKKFQDLRKKNDEMKTMKVQRKRKRRQHKKGVNDDTMKMSCFILYVDVESKLLLLIDKFCIVRWAKMLISIYVSCKSLALCLVFFSRKRK